MSATPKKRQVFYSFHYENDVFRTQQVRNMGVIEGNALASANDWEEIKRGGEKAIQRWIDNSMSSRSCVIVLIGGATFGRKWIEYEICKAWNENKGLFGIYIHNLDCPRSGTCLRGKNPFDNISSNGIAISRWIKCYDPSHTPLVTKGKAYNSIESNITKWIETAINDIPSRGIAAK